MESIQTPVSYTHLDVYKRQVPADVFTVIFLAAESSLAVGISLLGNAGSPDNYVFYAAAMLFLLLCGGWLALGYLLDFAVRIKMCIRDRDMEAENAAERYLAELTAGDTSVLMYESKASIRSEFEQFQKMFFLLGGVLCAVIGLVGILNFFNAIMTGILARKREFAVLQSVGMTNRQLKQMLVQEGLFYTAGSVVVAFLLSLVCGPLSGDMMEKMFWFCTYHFTILPVIAMLPVFAVLGCLIPAVLYQAGSRQSIVERLREAE